MASSKISIIVVTGSLERLQMAAMLASVGAVSGNDVSVFLSMNSLQYFLKGHDQPPPAEGRFGTQIFPCSMAMDVMNIGSDALQPWLGEPLGLTKFLADAQDGQVYTF
jgi:peroxiredoxin family protein